MTRIQARVALLALLVLSVALPAALTACGGDGGGGDEDPSEVLEQTFNNPKQITSGQLGISLDAAAEGSQAGSLTATLDGPFQTDESDPAAFPQLDLSVQVSASGAGDFDGGLIATEDNAFVEYQGEAYEVGTSVFQRFAALSERSARQAQANKDARSIFDRFGVDPQGWLTNVSNEGDEDVEGAETIHIHGDADVEQIFSDFARIVQRVPGEAEATLDPDQLDQVQSAIREASVDVYSGKDDRILRRLGVSLAIEPTGVADTSTVSRVDIDLSLTLSDVNEPQTISAPSDAKPISELLSEFGLSGLGSLGSQGGGVGGGGGPAPAYLDCIQDATTSDEVKQCAEHL